MNDENSFRTFDDFYPFYLGEHANRTCRRLHFAGTSIAVALLIAAVVTRWWWLIAVALVQGYAFAWVGHSTYTSEEWKDAVAEAHRAHNKRTAEYLLGLPILVTYLEEGLAAFGESCG